MKKTQHTAFINFMKPSEEETGGEESKEITVTKLETSTTVDKTEVKL